MSTLSPDMQQLHHEALQRRARQRLDDLEDMRAVMQAKASGKTQREIAELVVTSQSRVHRLLQAAAHRKNLKEKLPEEIILEAFVEETPRDELLEKLKSLSYTFATHAPHPDEGRLPGTWDQVVSAYVQELLTKEEFIEVSNAIGRQS